MPIKPKIQLNTFIYSMKVKALLVHKSKYFSRTFETDIDRKRKVSLTLLNTLRHSIHMTNVNI